MELLAVIAYIIGVIVGRYLVPNPKRRPVTIEAVYSFPTRPYDNQQVYHMNKSQLFTYKAYLGEWLPAD